jgi:hypothetical protein
MLQSPFSFYRGAAGVMASDLAQMPHTLMLKMMLRSGVAKPPKFMR